jgi:phosphinothricin acetyltransferase
MIRDARAGDAAALCAIYNPYVRSTVVTFEESPVSAADMAERIAQIRLAHPWLVCELDGEVAGYAYAGPWRTRSAYRFAVETTIYLAPGHVGRGVGRALYEALLAECARRGFHCAMGGIALPNPASVALHEKVGFVKVAHFREVGLKLDRRIDVGYWQRML